MHLFIHFSRHYIPTAGLLFIILFFASTSCAQPKRPAKDNIFHIESPDYQRSPYTGMTRKHWIEGAKYLLEGAFSYVHTLDDPMKFPKQPGKSYPQNANRYPTEKLEGLCRTLYIAMPLLKEDSTLTMNHIKVADYYRHHLACITDSLHPSFIPHRKPKEGPSQNLVEFGALALSLSIIPDILWTPLSPDVKDRLAYTMLSYAEGPTVPNNWRFFNIFVLSFLKEQGYTIDDNQLERFIEQSLNDYRGDGWYIDNAYFDYYSMWAYQMYGMVWCEYYGNKYYPEYAQRFTANFKDMLDSYPYQFDRNGQMIMWGRSICYRFASVSPLPLAGWLNDSDINYGWLRQISSATLLQFLQNDQLLEDRVPTLGFYGAFEPAIQSYSCRGSVYWVGKVFLNLLLPEDNPFWSATENRGAWDEELKGKAVCNQLHAGANILVTNYPASGVTEVRSCPNVARFAEWENWRASENYNRLSYNSRFLWMADGENGEVAMNYIVKGKDGYWNPLTNYTFQSFDDSIYYRNAFARKMPACKFELADITLPNGILRVDRITTPETISLRLGHYALPQGQQAIKEITVKHKGQQAYIIDNGDNRLAMIPLSGWDDAEFVQTKHLHPATEQASVINTQAEISGSKVFVTLMLWKCEGKTFTKKELFPIKQINISNDNKEVTILFTDKTVRKVHFE